METKGVWNEQCDGSLEGLHAERRDQSKAVAECRGKIESRWGCRERRTGDSLFGAGSRLLRGGTERDSGLPHWSTVRSVGRRRHSSGTRFSPPLKEVFTSRVRDTSHVTTASPCLDVNVAVVAHDAEVPAGVLASFGVALLVVAALGFVRCV